MAHRVLNGVKQLATGTGTGTLTLGSVFSDRYQTMAFAGMANGDTIYVRIEHETIEDQWEIVLVTYNADVLTRTFDAKSDSPTGGLTTFSAGNKIVSVPLLADQVVHKDNNDNVSLPGELAVVQHAKTAENLFLNYGVGNLAALKALTSRPPIVTVADGSARGVWGWFGGLTETANDFQIVECTSGDPGRYCKLSDAYLSLRAFGATGDGTTDDSAAMDAWWLAVNTSGLPGYIPPGHYVYTGTRLSWDLNFSGGTRSRKGGLIYGAGPGLSLIDVKQCSGSPQFEVIDTSLAAFYWVFQGFGIVANTTGVGSSLGRDWNGVTYADYLNSCAFLNCTFNNDHAAGDTALRINGLLQSRVDIVCNNGGVQIGDAIQMFGISFCSGLVAAGHAENGVHMSGYAFGNNFTCDIEVVNHCIYTSDVIGAGGPSRNKFSGVFVWGATNGDPNISGNDGTTDCIIADHLGGPLIFDGSSQFGSADPPQYVGAFAGNVIFEQKALGVADFGGLRVSRPPGVPALLQYDTEFDQSIQFQFRRNAELRWLQTRDTTAETGGNAGTLMVFEAFDDNELSLGPVLTLEREPQRASSPGLWATVRMQIPAYLVGTLPPVSPAAQIIYLNDESGGATLAFSDGTNWRRVTDNAIVS